MFLLFYASCFAIEAATITFPSQLIGPFGQKDAGFSVQEGNFKWEVTSGSVWFGTPSFNDWALGERTGGTPGEVTIIRNDLLGGLFTLDSFGLIQRDSTPSQDIKIEGFVGTSSVGAEIFPSTDVYTVTTPNALSSAPVDRLVISLRSSGPNFAAIDDIVITSIPEPNVPVTILSFCFYLLIAKRRRG